MPAHILMNVVDEQELRVAVIRDGRLDSVVHERIAGEQVHLGNIYKAKVANVEPSLDAAFIDLGTAKNGFLHIDDVTHDKGRGKRIEQVLRPGQEILVQVTKEPIKEKGPCLTTSLSIPGRYLVLVQDPDGLGVSKRIEDPAVRKRLKRLLASFEAPEGFGYIVRTAGAERSDEDLALDQEYLSRLWKEISSLTDRSRAPAIVYREADVVLRTLRELADAAVESVVIDSEQCYDEARAFAMVFMPELSGRIQLHREELPLFAYYGVEDRLATISDREVQLPSGGAIVIEQTEALVSIDVNSARNREGADVHATALATNLEAVQVVAEQLILRDLGGLIIIDFIDMESRDHQRLVQLALRKALLRDKAKTNVGAMSRFGLVEMTRSRTRPSHKLASSQECPYCQGTGAFKTPETVAIEVMRGLRQSLVAQEAARIDVVMPTDLALAVLNARAAEIAALERQYDCRIQVQSDPLIKAREFRIQASGKKKGRRSGEKPVHPGLLASWLEIKARVRAEAQELIAKGSAAIERELEAAINGQVAPAAAPEAPKAPESVAASPAPVAAPVANAPSLLEDAWSLRQLLFRPPQRHVVEAAAAPAAASAGLAKQASGASLSPSEKRAGPRRRHRRSGRG